MRRPHRGSRRRGVPWRRSLRSRPDRPLLRPARPPGRIARLWSWSTATARCVTRCVAFDAGDGHRGAAARTPRASPGPARRSVASASPCAPWTASRPATPAAPARTRYWAVFVARGGGAVAALERRHLDPDSGRRRCRGLPLRAVVRHSGRAAAAGWGVRGGRLARAPRPRPSPRRATARRTATALRRRHARRLGRCHDPTAAARGLAGAIRPSRPWPVRRRRPLRPRPAGRPPRGAPASTPGPAPGLDLGLLAAALAGGGLGGLALLRLAARRRRSVTSGPGHDRRARPTRPLAGRPGLAPRAWLIWSLAAVTVALVSGQPGLPRPGRAGRPQRPADVAAARPEPPAARRGRDLGRRLRRADQRPGRPHRRGRHRCGCPRDWPLVGGPLTARVARVRRCGRARARRGAAGRGAALAGPRAARRRRRDAGAAGADRHRRGHLAQPRLGFRPHLHRRPRRPADARLAAARPSLLERGPGPGGPDGDRGFGPAGRGDGGARLRRRPPDQLRPIDLSVAGTGSSSPRRSGPPGSSSGSGSPACRSTGIRTRRSTCRRSTPSLVAGCLALALPAFAGRRAGARAEPGRDDRP